VIKIWQKKGFLPMLLLPLSYIYSLVHKTKFQLTKSKKYSKKIICIGNITTGGAGKTPVAIAIAKLLLSKGKKVCFAVKNYKSKTDSRYLITKNSKYDELVIEEAYETAQVADTYVASARRQSIDFACNSDADIIIVDDGMQNNSFFKDKTALVIDGDQKTGNDFIIPAGPMRESLKEGIKKADFLVIINMKDSNYIENLASYGKPIFEMESTSFIKSHDKKRKYFAFCGIGFPEKFFNSLKSMGVKIVKTKKFPDHYNYKDKDLRDLSSLARRNNASLITTRKDAIKINNIEDLYVANYELVIKDSDKLLEALDEKS